MTVCHYCHHPYHPNESCTGAADRRHQWEALDAHVEQQLSFLTKLAGRTPMSEVPATFRGPNWKA